MSDDLVRNRITVRGKEYIVRELRGREMASVRVLLGKESERSRIPAYVASIASEPSLGTEKECLEMPHLLIEAIATESLRMTNPPAPKKGEGEEEEKKD